jgi:hypothetical protein
MSSEILSVTIPMGADRDVSTIPVETFEADLNGNGSPERVEVDTLPRLTGSPFREWRVYRDGSDTPVGVGAGISVEIGASSGGRFGLVSDGAYWTLHERFGLIPYGDLLAPRTRFMETGDRDDQGALQGFGVNGIFRENVHTITVGLRETRAPHRVISGSGFAFMDEASEASPFLITTPDRKPIFGGWSGAHPWMYRNGDAFTVVSKNRFGFQVSIIPGGLFE